MDENKAKRLRYCLDKRDLSKGLAMYEDILDNIFIEKKWFFDTELYEGVFAPK